MACLSGATTPRPDTDSTAPYGAPINPISFFSISWCRYERKPNIPFAPRRRRILDTSLPDTGPETSPCYASLSSSPDLLAKLVRSLANCALFNGMEPPLLKEAETHATLVQAEPGEHLPKEGEVAEAFFVILNGKASALVHRDQTRGDEGIEVLGPGDPFGDVATFLKEPLGASVRATGVVVAARFPAVFFDDMAARVPGFGLALARSVAKRLQRASPVNPHRRGRRSRSFGRWRRVRIAHRAFRSLSGR